MIFSSQKETEYEAVKPSDGLEAPWATGRKTKWMDRTVRIRLPIIVLAVAFQITAWLAIVAWAVTHSYRDPHSMGYYPAAEAIRYHEITFEDDHTWQTLDLGLPSPETDKLWKDIQAPTDGMVELSYETGIDLSKLQPSITSAVDHSLHMYGIDMFHNLHCLDRIRRSFYPSHYFPNETEVSISHHKEQCLNHLRQSIMCHGDVSLDRWWWDKETKHSYVKTDVPHVCRDFDMLKGWVEKHKYKQEDWVKSELKPSD